MKRFVRWLLSPAVSGTLGLVALSVVIWWVGPLIAIASVRPLAPLVVRVALLVLLWCAWTGRLAWLAWKRRRTNDALLRGIAAGPGAADREAQVLEQRFADAVARLQAGQRGRLAGRGGYLYELPWYLFVGAPGSGKTTALMNAGLQFLLGDAAKGAVRGVGGTRNCDWWFTKDAVLIDTAGRYATQDSDRDVDASAWDRFLALLKKTRPRQPINGVLLTVNVQDLWQQGAPERREHAAKLRARLQELHAKLGVRAPVYVLVTKADLIGGFNESFERLDQEERDQVWGFTFAPDASPADPLAEYPARAAELRERLAEQLLERLEAERDPARRAAIFAFPQEFAALEVLLAEFLRQVFSEGGSLEAGAFVRGVYFTSGTQEGTPIDRVMGALGRSFGVDARSAAIQPGRGKSYFLHRLLRDVVFAERGLGVRNPAAERRRRGARVLAFASIAVLATALLVGWAVSRSRNLHYAAEVAARVPPLGRAVDALPPPVSADVAPLPGVLAQVREVAQPSGFPVDDPPLLDTLGLYQGDKLDAGAQLAYQRLLQKALMPRIARRLEERLRAAGKDDLEYAYEALKSYLMLYTPEQFDALALKAWIEVDWDHNYAQMAPADRAQLERHLDAALAAGVPHAVQPLDRALVQSVRELLAGYPLEYRIFSRIRRSYRSGEQRDFTVAAAAGPNAAQVFERASGEPLARGISGFYTRAGFTQAFQPALPKAALGLAREESWVLGLEQDAARLKELAPGGALADRVTRLYCDEYIKTWDAYLADVRLVRLGDLERSVAVARLVSAVDSPLAAYLRAVAAETTLVAPPAAGAADKLAAAARSQLAQFAGNAPSAAAGGPVERVVDDHFASIRRQVAGQPAPIDETLKLFNTLYVQLSAVQAARTSQSPPPAGIAAAAVKTAAGQQPEPIRSMLGQLADAGESQSRGAELQGLAGELKPITDFCNKAITGRYPFASGSRADVLPEDFGALFGAGGLIDSFYSSRLAPLVDSSAPAWAYKPLADGKRPAPPAALADFQRAARIKEVFFRGGGKAPAIRIELKLQEIDPALKELVLDVDGQVQKLTSGGPSAVVQWPSARLATQVQLATGLGSAGPLLLFDGPWALFRLFDQFELQPAGVPERFSVVMNLDGRRARVEVISASVFNPFRMKEMEQFRCPASL